MKKIPIIAAAAVSFIGAGSAFAQSYQGLDVDAGHSRIGYDGETVSTSKVDASVAYGFGRSFGVQGDLGYVGLNGDDNGDAFSFRLLGRYDVDRALSVGLGIGTLQPYDDNINLDSGPYYSLQAMYVEGPLRVEGGWTHYEGDDDPSNALSVAGQYAFVPGVSTAYGEANRLNMDDAYADQLIAGYEQGFGSFDLHGQIKHERYDDEAATGVYVGGSVGLSPDVALYGELGQVYKGDETGNALSAGLRWQVGRGKTGDLFRTPLNKLDFAGF